MTAAFVLNADDLAGSDSLTFPGFPGVWTPGRPIEASEFVKAGSFGSVDEMRDRVAELGLPLEAVDVAEGAAPMPERDNHLPSTADVAADVVDKATAGRVTHATLDQAAGELGYRFSDSPRPTLEQKTAALDAIRAGEPQDLATLVDEVAERADGGSVTTGEGA